MTVRELITRLLDFNMEAEVKIDQPYNDPKPTVGGLELDGKTHTLTVNSYISVYYNPSTRQCQATITPQIIKYDNSTTYSPNGVYLAIVKTK
jgi:hypothetical protein